MPARPEVRGVHSCTRSPAYQNEEEALATEFHQMRIQSTHLMSKKRKLLKKTVKKSRKHRLERQRLRKRVVLVEGAGEENRLVFCRPTSLATPPQDGIGSYCAISQGQFVSLPQAYSISIERSWNGVKSRSKKS